MSEYEHEIFVSYRRSDKHWIRWTREIFVDSLTSLLRPALGEVRVFLDEQIETGANWPAHLARSLSRSKLMVPVLSRDYFKSKWCRLELQLMYERQKNLRARPGSEEVTLILPVTIDDGTCFPTEIQELQSEGLHDFANPFILKETSKQYDFAEFLKARLCQKIEKSLTTPPPCDPVWAEIAQLNFSDTFHISMQSQTTLPSLGTPHIL